MVSRWLPLWVRNLVAPSYNYATDKETFPTVLRTGVAKQWLNQHLTTAQHVRLSPNGVLSLAGMRRTVRRVFGNGFWARPVAIA